MLPYNAVQHSTAHSRFLMTLPRWGRKVLLLAIIPVSPQTLYTPPMLVQCWASVADFGLTLKQHWVKISFEKYLVISLVVDINAVSPYSIVYCRPTRHRPTHARFAVEWIFKHVLEKKFVCDISGKNCSFLIREKNNVMFSYNVVRKKNHTLPPGIKWSAPNAF